MASGFAPNDKAAPLAHEGLTNRLATGSGRIEDCRGDRGERIRDLPVFGIVGWTILFQAVGGWVNPDVAVIAVMPSAQRPALEFAMTFFATTFMTTMLSFAYVSRTGTGG